MFYIPKEITFILENNITLMGHKGNSGDGLVHIRDGGTFKMNAGTKITGNTGGGVHVVGIFEMSGGDISGNTRHSGGGVYVFGGSGQFTMTGGTISNNTAKSGGGMYIVRGILTMRGGVITGNTASEYGGGIYLHNAWGYSVEINKTGGTITGAKSDPSGGNAVKDVDGNDIARKGHAIWYSLETRKETTAGENVNLSIGGTKGKTGDWDN
jgi:parallel beta-helix repeat protein